MKSKTKAELLTEIKSLKNKLKKLEETKICHESNSSWNGAKVSDLYKNIPMSISYINNNGVITDCNPATEALYGYPKNNIIGKQLTNFMSPHSVEEHHLNRNINEKEFQIINSKGLIVEIWRKEVPITDEENNQIGFLAFDQDITHRWIEEELINLQSAVLEATANTIVITNIRGDIVWVNSAFSKLTGYDTDEVIYKNLRILKSGFHEKQFYASIWETILSGGVWHGEIINKRKDNTFYYEEQTITPVRNRQNEISHFISVKQDITERKKAEEALHLSYIKYEELAYIVNHSPAIGFLWGSGEDWPVEFVSDNVKQFGYVPEDFYSGKLTYLQLVHPEDRERIKEEIRNYQEIGTENFQQVYRIMTKDGEIRWLDVRILLRHKEKDEINNYQGVVLDVTETKLVEETLQKEQRFLKTVLLNITDGIITCDSQGNLNLINRAAKKIYEIHDSLLKIEDFKKYFKMLQSDGQTKIEIENHPLFEILNGNQVKNCELVIHTKSQQKKNILHDGQLLHNADGVQVGAVLVLHDITESKEAERNAKLHQEQLIQADKMVALGTLVSGVAHEINNPNNFVILNVPILRKTWNNILPILNNHYNKEGDFYLGSNLKYSKMKDSIPILLNGIEDGSERIKNIVKELKDFARKESSIEIESIDINEVLKAAITLTTNLINKSTNKFEVNFGKDLPKVKGNFQRLEQVLINLIENSCQALTDKGKGIIINTDYDERNGKILICVEDEGIGMTKSILKEIMDPFFTTKRDIGGTGLGLSVSSKIVLSHGGSLNFDSTPGEGTRANLSFPIQVTARYIGESE